MVLAQRAIAGQQIARGVVLPGERGRCRLPHQLAERLFRQHLNRQVLLLVQFLDALELVAGRRAPSEPLAANHQHRYLRVDIVSRRTAKPADQRACILAAERAQLSGEDDQVAGK